MSISDDALLEQRMLALDKGNQIRSAKAQDKREMKAGLMTPATILKDPPGHWLRATLLELLTSMHMVGRSRAVKWLKAERLSPGLEVGQLNELQRYRLAKHVDAACARQKADPLAG